MLPHPARFRCWLSRWRNVDMDRCSLPHKLPLELLVFLEGEQGARSLHEKSSPKTNQSLLPGFRSTRPPRKVDVRGRHSRKPRDSWEKCFLFFFSHDVVRFTVACLVFEHIESHFSSRFAPGIINSRLYPMRGPLFSTRRLRYVPSSCFQS